MDKRGILNKRSMLSVRRRTGSDTPPHFRRRKSAPSSTNADNPSTNPDNQTTEKAEAKTGHPQRTTYMRL
ncbi:uncharacterized protein SCHCODRAFT_02616903 [Schizophyllum commune H4-8]|uniref:uncharacterized protein n=1 Tax=Schizophyllum commune (strain H4-8 / FGSC 9210) TaxID=578458 RepID=UPI0021605112|nr:uncharacterized protein SCHCODRAFT_02616903 [Schizophyllum commune H4-8]KAI5897182.1 hypothetical protein SCHCODRAFT_02616903 [Schizophyllum commune H4-8]